MNNDMIIIYLFAAFGAFWFGHLLGVFVHDLLVDKDDL